MMDDGWMMDDGVHCRPNHMPSHLDASQTTGTVNFRRLAGGLRSVAKKGSFYVAFGADFRGLWRPKWHPKFDFRAIFSIFF